MQMEELWEALRQGAAEERITALAAVENDAAPEHLEPALAALSDAHPTVRRLGVRILEQLGEPRAAGPLLGVLDDRDPAVRAEAERALCALQGAGLCDVLVPALFEASVHKRLAALRALRGQPDARALPGVMRALSDPDARVRVEAVRVFALVGTRALVASLGASLDDPDAEVRVLGLATWLRLAPDAGYEPCLRAANDPHWAVRREAVRGLGQARVVGSAGVLAAAALSDPSWEVQREAVLALGKLGAGEHDEALWSALGAAQPDVRRAVLEVAATRGPGLGRARSERVRRAAEADPDGEVRKAALRALAALEG